MPQPHDPAWANRVCCLYAVLLRAYPKAFRTAFGYEMQQMFRDRYRTAAATNDLPRFAGAMFWDWLRSSVRERFSAAMSLEINSGQEMIEGWWLLALCGIIDATIAGMNFLMLNPDGRFSLRRFALPDTVWDMSVLALAAGACAIAAALWNLGKGSSRLLALHGLALACFGVIGASPLVRGPISFRPISLLFVLMAVSAGALTLRTSQGLRNDARNRRFLIVTGAALFGFACSFPVVGFGLVRLQSPNSYWIWMSSYFSITALSFLSMAISLRRSGPAQLARRLSVL
jgi:hypothetical protein